MDYKRILVLRYTNGMSSREIAERTGDGKTTVNDFLKRFRECTDHTYPLPEEVTNEFLANHLYKHAGNLNSSELYREYDPEEVHKALAKKGETLKHLSVPCGYRGKSTTVKAYPNHIEIWINGSLAATHNRLFGHREESLDIRNYLSILSRKGRAIRFARPCSSWFQPPLLIGCRARN